MNCFILVSSYCYFSFEYIYYQKSMEAKAITDLETLSTVIKSVLEGSCHDATLLVEGERIPIHKDILSGWSSYFKELFKVVAGQTSGNSSTPEGTANNIQEIVEIKDVKVRNTYVYELSNVKVNVLKIILNYIYSGIYEFDGEIANHLNAMELAHLYNLESLKTKLVDHLVEFINVDNFFDFFNLKTLIQNEQLETSCIDFLKINADEIAMSENFPKLNMESLLLLLDDDSFATAELNIFRAAEMWANVNKPNGETIATIVEKIRLATIPQEDLFDVVAASTDLPAIDIMEPLKSIAKKDAASKNFRPIIQEDFENVALSSMGAKLLTGNVHEADLISGSTGWTTHRVGGNPACITVELDKPHKINEIKFTIHKDGVRTNYVVEVSVDGSEWTKVVDRSNMPCSGKQSHRFDTTTVKFIKLRGVNCTELTISELEARYSTRDCRMIEGIRVATSNMALSSKGATAEGTDFDHSKPEYCLDTSKDSYASIEGNTFLYITLPEPYWISSLRMLINSHGNNYTIDSYSGDTWQSVCKEVLGDNLEVWREFEFSRRIVVEFRIRIKPIPSYNKNQNYIQLYCFESPASTIAVPSEDVAQTS